MAAPVLLVHDDIATIASVRRLLAREGYEVILASSAADALIAFGHYLPGLIILAPSVEGGRGRVVLEELAQHPDAKLARVLLLGESIPGFGAPVAPLPLDGQTFLQLVQEAFRAAPEAQGWQVMDEEHRASISSDWINDSPEPWRAAAPPEMEPGEPESGEPAEVSDEDWSLIDPEAEERARRAEATAQAAMDAAHQEVEAEAMASIDSNLAVEPHAHAEQLESELTALENEVRAEAAERRRQREVQAPPVEALPPASAAPEAQWFDDPLEGDEHSSRWAPTSSWASADESSFADLNAPEATSEAAAGESTDEVLRAAELEAEQSAEPAFEGLGEEEVERLSLENARKEAEQAAQRAREQAHREVAERARLRAETEAARQAQAKLAQEEANEPPAEQALTEQVESESHLAEVMGGRDEAEPQPTEEVQHARQEAAEPESDEAQRGPLATTEQGESERHLAEAMRAQQETERQAEQELEAQQQAEEELAQKLEAEAAREREEAERQAQEELEQKLEAEAAREREEAERQAQEELEQKLEAEAAREREETERQAQEELEQKLEAESARVREDAERRSQEELERKLEDAERRAQEMRAEAARLAQAEAERAREEAERLAQAEIDQLEKDRAAARQEAARRTSEAAAHEAAARLASERADVLAEREKAALAAAAKAREVAEAARRESKAAATQLKAEAAQALRASRDELDRAEKQASAEREAREQLEAELKSLKASATAARAEAERAQANAEEAARRAEAEHRSREESDAARRAAETAHREAERARLEAEHARKLAEESARRASEEAKVLATAAVIPLTVGGDSIKVPAGGAVGRGELAALVVKLCRAKVETRLELKAGDALRTLWIQRGTLVGALSTVPQESLLDRARRDGLIGKEQESEIRLLRSAPAAEVMNVLKARGYLRETEMIPLVQRHAEQIALEALSEEQSVYRLAPEPIPPEIPSATAPRAVLQLLAEALRRAADPDDALRAWGGLRAIVFSEEDGLEPGGLGFTDRDRRLLAAADGERTLEQLLRGSGMRQDDAVKVLRAAEWTGLIRIEAPLDAPGEPSAELDVDRLDAKFDQVQEGDYFSILGLPRSAGVEEVQRAYSALAAEFHPLKFAALPDPSLQHRARQIHEALAEAAHVLQDDRLRKEYARHLVD